MPCPYFRPGPRRASTAKGSSFRPPLGAIHEGDCALRGSQAPENLIEDACNYGYATGCPDLPRDRPADAHRFVAVAPAPLIRIRWARERSHRPIDCGEARYDVAKGVWSTAPPDALAEQTTAYLENYRACASTEAQLTEEQSIE